MKPINFKDRQEELRHLRETALLDEASRLLRESNFLDLNMDMLAEKVGISKKTLYQHFRTRDELIARVLLNGFQALEEEIAKVAHLNPLERIKHVLQVYMYARFFPGGLLASIAPEIVVRIKHSNEEVRQRMHDLSAVLSGVIDEAKQRGEIRRDLNSQLIVRSMFCLSSALNDLPPQSTTDNTPYDLNQAIEELIQLFFYGIVAPPQ